MELLTFKINYTLQLGGQVDRRTQYIIYSQNNNTQYALQVPTYLCLSENYLRLHLKTTRKGVITIPINRKQIMFQSICHYVAQKDDFYAMVTSNLHANNDNFYETVLQRCPCRLSTLSVIYRSQCVKNVKLVAFVTSMIHCCFNDKN